MNLADKIALLVAKEKKEIINRAINFTKLGDTHINRSVETLSNFFDNFGERMFPTQIYQDGRWYKAQPWCSKHPTDPEPHAEAEDDEAGE